MNSGWLEGLLKEGLRPESAPDSVWERLWQRQQEVPARRAVWPRLVFGGAAAVAAGLITIAVLPTFQGSKANAAVLRSDDPREIRAWVRKGTGLDLPLSSTIPGSIQLVEARALDKSAEIVFKLDGYETVLSAVPATTPKAPGVHEQGQRTWQARGIDYELQGGPASLETTCQLCHGAP
jgi:hypothetical protein